MSELVLERWDDEPLDGLDEARAGMSIFELSGGVLGPTKTSNRIDSLLGKMLVTESSGKYLGDIDKNLDYLYTSLQLDLIGRVAEDLKSHHDEDVQEEPPEPVISLDRVRQSF